MDGLLETTALGNINGYSPVQRHPPVVGAPLPDPQAWSPACRLPEELHVTAARIVAFAGVSTCGWGVIASLDRP